MKHPTSYIVAARTPAYSGGATSSRFGANPLHVTPKQQTLAVTTTIAAAMDCSRAAHSRNPPLPTRPSTWGERWMCVCETT